MGRYDIDVYGEGRGSSTTGKYFLIGLAILGAVYFIKEILPPLVIRLRSNIASEAKRGATDIKRYGLQYLLLFAFVPLFVLLLSSGINETVVIIFGTICAFGLCFYFLYKNA